MAKVEQATIKHARLLLKWADHFRRIANAPLKKQDSSDAWSERQAKLAASRDAINLRLRGTYELNKAKNRAKKAK